MPLTEEAPRRRTWSNRVMRWVPGLARGPGGQPGTGVLPSWSQCEGEAALWADSPAPLQGLWVQLGAGAHGGPRPHQALRTAQRPGWGKFALDFLWFPGQWEAASRQQSGV